jgi:hypothetical protein
MPRPNRYVLFFLSVSILSNAQVRHLKPVVTHPKSTNFALGAGLTSSVLFLSRNIKDDNNVMGFNFSVVYGGSKLIRVCAEYTAYKTINIDPTWFTVKANTIEVNGHVLAWLNDKKGFFYPIGGLSINKFSGFFTGVNDFQNLSGRYSTNSMVINHWLGVNTGVGFERYFRPFSFFAEFKMRTSLEDRKRLNIIDVCYSAGFRFNVRVPSVYRLYSGTRSRYLLDTKESD